MRAGTIWDAVRAGDPAVITVAVILLVLTAAAVYLTWARRPIKPKTGSLTVDVLKARLAKEAEEVQSKIRENHEAHFKKQAEETAPRRAVDTDTRVLDTVPRAAVDETAHVPPYVPPQQRTRLSRKRRPYAGRQPRPWPTPRVKAPA